MHLSFALLACNFLPLVNADDAHYRFASQQHRRRQASLVSYTNSSVVPNTQSVASYVSTSLPSGTSQSKPSSSSSPSLSSEVDLFVTALPVVSSGLPSILGTAFQPSGLSPASASSLGYLTNVDNSTRVAPALNLSSSVETSGLAETWLKNATDATFAATQSGNATVLEPTSNTTLRNGNNPIVTGFGAAPNSDRQGWNKTDGPPSSKNGTCGGCAINAQAGLYWFYPSNIVQAISSVVTISLNATTSYSMTAAQTSVDIEAQLLFNAATFIYTETFDPQQNATVDDFIYTTMPTPQAASTSVMTISDVEAAPNGTFGIEFLKTMYTSAPVPSVVIPGATGSAATVAQPTNVVYYTAYEVETEEASIDAYGQVFCQTSTVTYNLPAPYAYEYDGIGLGDAAFQSGDVLDDFVSTIPESSCVAGSWVAAPTMIVVVEVTYRRSFLLLIAHHENSDVGGLVTPTPTPTTGRSPDASVASEGDGGGAGGANVVSAVANVDGTEATVLVTVTGNPASATVSIGTQIVVASVIGGSTAPGSGASGSDNSGALGAAIVKALGGGDAASASSSTSGSGGNVNGIGFAVIGNSGSSGSGSSGSLGSGSGLSSGGNAAVVAPAAPAAAPALAPAFVPVLTIAGSTVVGNAATQFLVAPGQTLTPGGSVVVGANTVGLASDANILVVNGQTTPLSAPIATPAPVLNFGGQVVSANAAGSFIIQGQTLTQGGQITLGSNTVSLAQGATALVVNGQTITRSAAIFPTGQVILNIGGSSITAASAGQFFIIGGQTLKPGAVITANGNTISLGSGSSSTIAVVNGVTQQITPIITPAAVNVGGTLFSESPGGFFIIGSQTLLPGERITVSGTTLSLDPAASIIVVNGQPSTIALGTIPAVVIGGRTYAATSVISGAYIYNGQVLTPGGHIVVSGRTISLAAGATALVVDGSTSLIKAPAFTTNPPLLTFAGQTYTANSGTTFTVDGQTLTPGGEIIVSGHTISLASGATAVVIDSKTTTLFPATTTTPQSISASTTSNKKTSTEIPTIASSTSQKGAATASTHLERTVLIIAGLSSFLSLVDKVLI